MQVKGALHISISQSGKSPDILAAAEQAKKAGAITVALLNLEDARLPNWSTMSFRSTQDQN